MNYTVQWEIGAIDADTPREAAGIALAIQRDRESIATHFTVIDDAGNITHVDLLEERA